MRGGVYEEKSCLVCNDLLPIPHIKNMMVHKGKCKYKYDWIKNKKLHQTTGRNRDFRIRKEAITHYGGKCSLCGKEELKSLCLYDKEMKPKRHEFDRNIYEFVRKNGYPKGWEVLCRGCRWAVHPELRQRAKENAKKLLEHPESLAKAITTLTKANQLRKEGELPWGQTGKKRMKRHGKLSRKSKRMWLTPKIRASIITKMKKNWENPEYSKKVFRRKPISGPEMEFCSIIKEFNLPYIFVGNGTVNIAGKNPDFIHTSNNKVIEIYGEFYHKGQNPQDRVDFFSKHGYGCKVFWASELKNKLSIANRVKEFSIV